MALVVLVAVAVGYAFYYGLQWVAAEAVAYAPGRFCGRGAMNHERDEPSEGEEVAARAAYALALGRPGTDQQSRAQTAP